MNKTAYEGIQLNNLAKASIPNITVPFLAIHGRDDKVTLPSSSEYLYKESKSVPWTMRDLKIYEGCKHHILFEKGDYPAQCKAAIVEHIQKYTIIPASSPVNVTITA